MSASFIRPDWPAPANVRAVSTLRDGGVSIGSYRSLNLGDHVGDSVADVAENRRRLRERVGLPGEPMWLRQVHGVAVVDLDATGAAIEAAADAAFTRRSGVVCAILTADCLPVLLTDVGGSVVAAAHAGWRGLSSGVLESTVSLLGCDPQDLLAWLGPCIGSQRFEVGEDVRDKFRAHGPSALAAFVPFKSGRFLADLSLLARLRLRSMGIRRIVEAGECTHSMPQRFFSFRRDGQTGRQATLIWKA